jgi:hypothetical protein
MCFAMGFTSPATASTALMTVQDVTQPDGMLAQKLVKELDNPETREKVEKLGISAEEARERIAALSDQEIRDLTGNPVQAGGDVVISLTAVLLIIIIILLIKR